MLPENWSATTRRRRMGVDGPSAQAVREATKVLISHHRIQQLSRQARRSSGHRHDTFLPRVRRIRRSDIEAAQPFMWTRCVISLFSYALLLSDVVRSGFGIDKSSLSSFPRPEPDSILHFGPFAYPIVHLSLENVSLDHEQNVGIWSYKYDTTSVSMRSVAQLLSIPEWPSCVFYRAECGSERNLSSQTLFTMIDSFVDKVSKYRGASGDIGQLTVRTAYDWFDRLHHFAFPWFFQRTVKRTTQAIYYRFEQSNDKKSICGHTLGPEPYACGDAWTRYQRLCTPSLNSLCAHVPGTVWSHIATRMHELQTWYPNHTIEFVIVEGADDHTRPGITFQGRKLVDIATLSRIRTCSEMSPHCSTVAVDDYRYESARMTINAPDWFGVVSLVRAIGQLYAWFRLAFLIAGTYNAMCASSDGKFSFGSRLFSMARIVLIIPSQVVIYGSIPPILCYVVAHLLDSTAVYELVTLRFNSPLGHFHFDFSTIVRLGAVSMRSLWTLAIVCHVIVGLNTRRSWSSTSGLTGVAEFAISFVASLTIFAQIRSTSWRSTKILQVHEMVSSTRRHKWQSVAYANPRTALNKLFFGSTIDMQCLLASSLLFLTLMLVSRLLKVILPRIIRYEIALYSRTLVPYSTGLLWLTNSLVVGWNGAFLVRVPRLSDKPLSHPNTPSLVRTLPFRGLSKVHNYPWQTTISSTVDLAIGDTEASVQLQHDMHSIDKRSREVEAMVFLINLAVMTDPLTYFRLCSMRGRLVSLVRSRSTGHRFLLPHALDVIAGDVPIDYSAMELILVVNSKNLLWCELLQCG